MSQLADHDAASRSCREPGTACDGGDRVLAILLLVSSRTAMTLASVRRPARRAPASVLAHQLAIYLVVVALDWTSSRAAAYFARDRKTVGIALARIEDLRDHDPALDAFCDGVERRFYAGGADGART